MVPDLEYTGNLPIKLSLKADYEFWTNTTPAICDDLKFFVEKMKGELDAKLADSYARGVIIFTAFYFESFVNILLETLNSAYKLNIDWKICPRTDFTKPLKKVLAIYKGLCGSDKNLSLNCNIIRDLFLIRNQVIAHPEGRSLAGGNEISSEKGTNAKGNDRGFQKFTNFPNIYSKYKKEHAEELYTGVFLFLKEFKQRVLTEKTSDDAYIEFFSLFPEFSS